MIFKKQLSPDQLREVLVSQDNWGLFVVSA